MQAAVDDDFKTPLDALRAIAAAGAPDNAIPEEEFSTVAAPEMQPALLMDVSQLASYPTVAHLGAPLTPSLHGPHCLHLIEALLPRILP